MDDGRREMEAGKPMEGARDEVRNLFFCQAQLAMHGAGPSLASRLPRRAASLQACKPAPSAAHSSIPCAVRASP